MSEDTAGTTNTVNSLVFKSALNAVANLSEPSSLTAGMLLNEDSLATNVGCRLEVLWEKSRLLPEESFQDVTAAPSAKSISSAFNHNTIPFVGIPPHSVSSIGDTKLRVSARNVPPRGLKLDVWLSLMTPPCGCPPKLSAVKS